MKQESIVDNPCPPLPYSFLEADWGRLGATPWKVLTRRCPQQNIFLMLILIIITVVKSIIIIMRYKNNFPSFRVCQAGVPARSSSS